jgi:hypothetical protein
VQALPEGLSLGPATPAYRVARKNGKQRMAFQRHRSAEERRRSAVILAKTLLQELPGLLPEHRRECLGIALWKYTEAEGISKYKTRFRSEATLAAASADLRHDYVFQRANMIEALMQAKSEDVDKIIKGAVGCTVTKDEHARLDQFKHLDGWERYRQARIVVIDMETGKPFELPPAR